MRDIIYCTCNRICSNWIKITVISKHGTLLSGNPTIHIIDTNWLFFFCLNKWYWSVGTFKLFTSDDKKNGKCWVWQVNSFSLFTFCECRTNALAVLCVQSKMFHEFSALHSFFQYEFSIFSRLFHSRDLNLNAIKSKRSSTCLLWTRFRKFKL